MRFVYKYRVQYKHADNYRKSYLRNAKNYICKYFLIAIK
jgi:hypothetical protein